jgi:hypothetical protein
MFFASFCRTNWLGAGSGCGGGGGDGGGVGGLG